MASMLALLLHCKIHGPTALDHTGASLDLIEVLTQGHQSAPPLYRNSVLLIAPITRNLDTLLMTSMLLLHCQIHGSTYLYTAKLLKSVTGV